MIGESYPIQFPTFFYDRRIGHIIMDFGSIQIRMRPGMFYATMIDGAAFAEGITRLLKAERAEGRRSVEEVEAFLKSQM